MKIQIINLNLVAVRRSRTILLGLILMFRQELILQAKTCNQAQMISSQPQKAASHRRMFKNQLLMKASHRLVFSSRAQMTRRISTSRMMKAAPRVAAWPA